jgi:proline dehydrogenase
MASLRRRVLFGLATNERLEHVVRRGGLGEDLAWRAARRYVAGPTLAEALAVSRRLAGRGLGASVDLFGEQVASPEVAERIGDEYVALARALGDQPESVWLSIDLSHIGLDVSAAFCRQQLVRVVGAIGGVRRIQVGAEDAARTDPVLEVVHALAADGAPMMATLQANLRRSPEDGRRLARAGIPIRLVKGAYVERPQVAWPWGEATDVAYLRLAHQLVGDGAALALATHDRVLREALLAAFGQRVSCELLLGVRPADADELAARGYSVRLYVPYGQDWFRYWMRRLAEAQGA